MPTTRPRHTITETPPVQEALAELRAKLNGDRLDFAELVILGAREKARRLPDGGNTEKARKARKELAKWIRNGNPGMVDIEAAEEVKVGDRLKLAEEGGKLVVTKVVSGNPVAAVYGILGAGANTDETIRALRGVPDAV